MNVVVSALFSAAHVAFLFMCLPGLLLVVSALFLWACSVSIHLSPRSVTAGVSAFRPACLPLSPFLLVTVSALSPFCSLCLRSCLPSCWSLCPPCLHLSPFVSGLVSLLVGHCPPCLPSVSFCLPSCFPFCWSLCTLCLPSPVLSPFLWVTVRLVSLLSPFVSLLVSLFVGHCVRFVCLLRSCLPSCWSLCPSCLPSVSFCPSSCLPLSPEQGRY